MLFWFVVRIYFLVWAYFAFFQVPITLPILTVNINSVTLKSTAHYNGLFLRGLTYRTCSYIVWMIWIIWIDLVIFLTVKFLHTSIIKNLDFLTLSLNLICTVFLNNMTIFIINEGIVYENQLVQISYIDLCVIRSKYRIVSCVWNIRSFNASSSSCSKIKASTIICTSRLLPSWWMSVAAGSSVILIVSFCFWFGSTVTVLWWL